MQEQYVCTKCMYPSPAAVCPRCGGIAKKPYSVANSLPPLTILNGRYLVGGVVGGGGFGITYRALDLTESDADKNIVAIKEYFPQSVSTRGEMNSLIPKAGTNFGIWREDFTREYELMRKAGNCSCVVNVRETFEENNTAYLVMDFIDGRTLTEIISSEGRFTANDYETYLKPFLSGLSAMHAASILHRDINPSNIMLDRGGRLRLIDFGSARPAPTAQRNLTVLVRRGYAPPEQYARDGNQGTWTDVFGMCATMYYAFTAKDPPDAKIRQSKDVIVPITELRSDLPSRLTTAIMKGLSPNIEDRPVDFEALVELIGLKTETVKKSFVDEPVSTDEDKIIKQYFTRHYEAALKTMKFIKVFNFTVGVKFDNELSEIYTMPFSIKKWVAIESAVHRRGLFARILFAVYSNWKPI